MKKITLKQSIFAFAMILLGGLPANLFAQTEISTVDGLKAISSDLAGSYKLTADITLTETWKPIGSADNPFTGTIDGNGHIITGLTTTDMGPSKIGFVGQGNGATIKNLGLELVNIKGHQNVGAFMGSSVGSTVENCYSTGVVHGFDHVAGIVGGCGNSGTVKSVVKDCYSTAYVYSEYYQAGGIVGTAVDLDISNVYFSGVCIALGENCGGISSSNDGHTDSWGQIANTISNSAVQAPAIFGAFKGGQMHRILGNKGNASFYTLTNNYANTDMLLNGSVYDPSSASAEDGATKADGASKTTAEMKTASFYAGTLGWSADNWTFTEGFYPTLKWQTLPAALDAIINLPAGKVTVEVGTVSSYLMCSSFGQALSFASSDPTVASVDANGAITALKDGTTTITVSIPATAVTKAVTGSFEYKVITISGAIYTPEDLYNVRYKLDGQYTLKNDITFEGDWTPIANFAGSFDGNGHVIKGLKFNNANENQVGLFKNVINGAVLNLGIEDANFVGNADVGAITGIADGSYINKCYVVNSYIEGSDHVGSITGNAKANTMIQDCYGTATVFSRGNQAAGIAGILNQGNIDRCYFSGTVAIKNGASNVGGMSSLLDGGDESSNLITNCVTLAPYLVGSTVNRIFANTNNCSLTMTNNYARVDVKRGSDKNNLSIISTDDVNYGADNFQGQNVSAADSKTAAFYGTTLTWDMDNVWSMVGEGAIYPILKWQTTPVTPSILGVSGDIIVKKGDAQKVIAYGSMGQAISFSSPQENQIVTKTVQYVDGTQDIDYVLFDTNNNLPFGVAAINLNSAATNYMNSASASFNMTVADPESLIKRINSVEDLQNMKNDLTFAYVLNTNLDLSSVENWDPIGNDDHNFTGSFDGNGYSISNLTSSHSSVNRIGLFGNANGATFKNIALINVNIDGNQDAAGIVGKANGIKMSNCFVTGIINGNDHVASLIGGLYRDNGTSTITNCYGDATVNTRAYQAGGLCGTTTSATFTNCYFTGSVASLATAMHGDYNVGGFTGQIENNMVKFYNCVSASSTAIGGSCGYYIARDNGNAFIISNCLYRSDMDLGTPVETHYTAPAGDARDLATLKTQATYAALGWDFTNVWTMNENEFPTLKGVGTVAVKNAQISGYSIFVVDGTVHIKGLSKAKISVYNVNGYLVGNIAVTSNDAAIKLPAKGVYLVRIVENNNVSVNKVVNN